MTSSLLVELAGRIHAAGERLPIGHLHHAADRLRLATTMLAWATHTSSAPSPVPRLAAAGEHLEHATAALLAAREALASYLVALGLPRTGVPAANRDWHAALAPVPPPPPPDRAADAPPLTSFWADRVDELTDHTGANRPGARDDAAPSSAELLHRCVRATLADDRAGLRRELVTAGPAVGLGLAAATPTLLRQLAADLVDHPPTAEDLPAVRRTARPRIADLLPGLPPEVPEEHLAHACHAPPRPADGRESTPTHPVDAAVAGAVLVAALLGATGRGADDLAAVIETERGRAAEESRRAADRAADAEHRRRPGPSGSGRA